MVARGAFYIMRKDKLMKKFIAIILLFFAVPVLAADLYVSKTGNDANDGSSWQEAKLTVQAAIDAASSGDEIDVNSGTYNESVTLSDGIALDGLDKTAIISCIGESETALELHHNCTIKNLTLSSTYIGTNTYGLRGAGKSNFVVEDCNINGSYDGVHLLSCHNGIFRNNIIKGKFDGGWIGGECSNLQFTNCDFTGLGTYGDVTCRGFVVGPSRNCNFTDCDFYGSRIDNSIYDLGGCLVINSTNVCTFNSCSFRSSGGALPTGEQYALRLGTTSRGACVGTAIVDMGTFLNEHLGSPSQQYDVELVTPADTAPGLIYIINSSYDKTKISGTRIIEAFRGKRDRYGLFSRR